MDVHSFSCGLFRFVVLTSLPLPISLSQQHRVSLARVLQTDEIIGSLCLRAKPFANKHMDESKDLGLIASFLCKQSLTA